MKCFYLNLIALLLATIGESYARYMGCYKELSIYARLLNGEHKNFPGDLTPDLCIEHCRGKGFRYAGVQFKFECFCSNERPSFKHIAQTHECNMHCDGDPTIICGGSLRLTVFDLNDESDVSPVKKQYIGCFKDKVVPGSSAVHTLNGYENKNVPKLIPEVCVGLCYSQGYRYAGVQYAKECYCGDKFDQSKKVADDECRLYACPGNPKLQCGGDWRLAIYHTDISDETHDQKLLGCFKDENTNARLLSGNVMNLKDTNSPRRCLNICLRLGFDFAGVEYKEECFCGNRRPNASLEVEENQCVLPCPGDKTEHCGGNYRILVFETGQDQAPRPSEAPVTRPTTRISSRPTRRTTPVPSLAVPLASQLPNHNCAEYSDTSIASRRVCKGANIFNDDFELGRIDSDTWFHSIYMPLAPDYEFVVFDKDPRNSFVKDGRLHIKPTVMNEDKIRRGHLNLQNCTGQLHGEECERQASGFNILPPILSARISTKDAFSFKYGAVTVRAKLPIGDWITPEIWLEPKRGGYGSGYRSGRIRIVTARGNPTLTNSHQEDIGIRTIESGVLMGDEENILGRAIKLKMDEDGGWSQHFHNYTLLWTPDNLSFLIDGEEQGSLIPPGSSETLAKLMGFKPMDQRIWSQGSNIAPFDQEFYIVIGVSVGGMRYYPDNSVSTNGYKKPWKNYEVKGLVNFWQARQHWQRTWNNEGSMLVVDRVSVDAL